MRLVRVLVLVYFYFYSLYHPMDFFVNEVNSVVYVAVGI
jgi:hypothetical protein